MSKYQENDHSFYPFQISLVACIAVSIMFLYYFSDQINEYILHLDGYIFMPFDKSDISFEVVLNNIVVGFKFLAGYAFAFWFCAAVAGMAVSFIKFLFKPKPSRI